MNFALDARKLADYIQGLEFFPEPQQRHTEPYHHIGALYTNIVLQAGLNYRTVVQPRVSRVLIKYPNAETVSGFLNLIDREGLENIIKWNHQDKVKRMHNVLQFSKENSINTCIDLANYLKSEHNQEKFLEIKGFGLKTLDYTLKLLNFDTIAVDRHIYSFVELAGLGIIDYKSTKKIVEFAADLLDISRASMDYSIWTYMSAKTIRNHDQLPLEFGSPGRS